MFPNERRWEKEHLMIYSETKGLFRAAIKDPKADRGDAKVACSKEANTRLCEAI
jgi:hypothetical protein